MQVMIECEYCGSLYDFNEHSTCPNCAAIPDKKAVSAAKAAAKTETKKSVQENAAKNENPPSSRLMTLIVKLVPLWIAIIFILPFVSTAIENNAVKKAVQYLQTVDELTFDEHGMNEEFLYDGKANITVSEAFYSESEIVATLLPEDKKLLVLHINGTIDVMDEDYFSYTRFSFINPYITNGEYCRERLNYSALDAIPEVYASNIFSFTNFSKYKTNQDGYWCFIVDEDDTELSLCINEISMPDSVVNIDLVHKINIEITE